MRIKNSMKLWIARGLNPCFNGRYSMRTFETAKKLKEKGS